MLLITSEIYFRDLNLIQEKQKNEPKQKKYGKPYSSHTFQSLGRKEGGGWLL